MSNAAEKDGRVDEGAPSAVTLGELCANLGPPLLTVTVASRGLDLPVTGVCLHDRRDEMPREGVAGHLLLAVGVSTADEEVPSLIRAAADAHIVAILCRDEGRWPENALEAAEELGVALLSMPTDLGWGEVYEIISAAIVVDDLESIVRTVDTEWRELNDLPAIVEALATITGGSVAIEDSHARIIAFSDSEHADQMRRAAILNHKLPEKWQRELRDRGIYEQLRTSDEILHVNFETSDVLPRRAAPIRFGRTALGAIWLAGDDATLAVDADEALRRAAPIAALQMMRSRLAVGVERRMHESAAASLLCGETTSSQVLAQVGLALDESLVVLVLAVASRSPSSPAAVAPRLVDLMIMHLRAHQRPAVATVLNGSSVDDRHTLLASHASSVEERVYVVTNSGAPEDRPLLRRILNEGVEHATRALGVELNAGIGHPVESLANMVVARSSADDCLRFGPSDPGVVAFEDIHNRALLADVDQFVDAWHGGTSDAFLALADHDAANGTEYQETLACLLDSFGSAPKVARRMHLHVNSARYRIRRIAEITGIDFSDGEARLALELTLRASLRRGEAASSAQPRTEKLDSSLISRNRE